MGVRTDDEIHVLADLPAGEPSVRTLDDPGMIILYSAMVNESGDSLNNDCLCSSSYCDGF